MPQSTKIATCSYCGTRAALILDQGRHELVCGSCGAPLHDMKMMPLGAKPAGGARNRVRVDWAAERRHALRDEPRQSRPKKSKKRRKPLARKVLGEIWDVVEDIFD